MLGLAGLGRDVMTAEMNMLMSSINDGIVNGVPQMSPIELHPEGVVASIPNPNLAVSGAPGVSTAPSQQPGVMSNHSLMHEISAIDGSLHLSRNFAPPISSNDCSKQVVSTPHSKAVAGSSLFSFLGVKRPMSAFEKVSAKKPRLMSPTVRLVAARGNPPIDKEDSGLDNSGVDSSTASCGRFLRDDSSSFDFSTPMQAFDGNISVF